MVISLSAFALLGFVMQGFAMLHLDL